MPAKEIWIVSLDRNWGGHMSSKVETGGWRSEQEIFDSKPLAIEWLANQAKVRNVVILRCQVVEEISHAT